MKYFYLLSFALIISCNNNEKEIGEYKAQIAVLETKNKKLNDELKTQNSELEHLEKWVAIQQENDILKQGVKDLEGKIFNHKINEELIGFESNLGYFLPSEILSVLKSISGEYKVEPDINPFFLKANLSTDDTFFYVLRIEHISSGKKGFIVFKDYAPDRYFIMGAGQPFNGVDEDLSYIGACYVEKASDVTVGYEGDNEVHPNTKEVVVLVTKESASAAFYLDEGEYKWKWIGD
ncbi:hypothetical protein [Flammeovirga sp. SubArs3]|uniref:hypothetical protein n=1 Tax=Flammeovirga sp. SubArs3 TaxID=2995316 RepID=UPI00248C6CE9|nr:hypothetical protein [Flammeovirga sp. SubArs3]